MLRGREAVPKMPWAVNVGQLQAREACWARALVMSVRLHQQGIPFVVPVDARAPALAGAEITAGRRVHTIHHGRGRGAWTARVETEVVGITGLTTDNQDGTPEHERHANRRDFQAHPINAVVVRQGPGGNSVFLPTAPVAKPGRGFNDDDDRRLMDNWCGKEGQAAVGAGPLREQTRETVIVVAPGSYMTSLWT